MEQLPRWNLIKSVNTGFSHVFLGLNTSSTLVSHCITEWKKRSIILMFKK